jgi:hypothetical protein
VIAAGILAGAFRTYLMSAASSYSAIAARSRMGIASFSAATLMDGGDRPTVEVTNLLQLERQLKELGPKLFNDFKRDARKLGHPMRDDVREAFGRIGPSGPFGWYRRPGRTYDGFNNVNGRLSWEKSYSEINRNSGIDVSYKSRNVNKQLYDLKTAKDGTISVVRVRIKKPALIMIDMAGRGRRSMYSEGRGRTRPYEIDLFGRGIVTRQHIINRANSDKFVDKLAQAQAKLKTKGSRYAYPAVLKHMPEYRRNVDKLLNQTIAQVNRSLGT